MSRVSVHAIEHLFGVLTKTVCQKFCSRQTPPLYSNKKFYGNYMLEFGVNVPKNKLKHRVCEYNVMVSDK
jgi:hypothetical protein